MALKLALNIQGALEHHDRVEAFQHKHRTGLVTQVFTDPVDSVALRRNLGDQAGISLLRALIRRLVSRIVPEAPDGDRS